MKDTICILVLKADLNIIRSMSWRDGLAGEGLPQELTARTQLTAGELTPLSFPMLSRGMDVCPHTLWK